MYAFSSRSRTILLALLALIVAVSVGAQVNPHGGGYPATAPIGTTISIYRITSPTVEAMLFQPMSAVTSDGATLTVAGGNTSGAVHAGGALNLNGGGAAIPGSGGQIAGGTVYVRGGTAGSAGNGGDVRLIGGASTGGTLGKVYVTGELNLDGVAKATDTTGSLEVLRIKPHYSGGLDFAITEDNRQSVGGVHRNFVSFGFNAGPGLDFLDGNSTDSLISMWMSINNVVGGTRYSEWGVTSSGPLPTPLDVTALGVSIPHDTYIPRVDVRGASYFMDRDSNIEVKIANNLVQAYDGVSVRKLNNNQSFLAQTDAAGTGVVDAMFVNALNEVEIAGGPTPHNARIPGGLIQTRHYDASAPRGVTAGWPRSAVNASDHEFEGESITDITAHAAALNHLDQTTLPGFLYCHNANSAADLVYQKSVALGADAFDVAMAFEPVQGLEQTIGLCVMDSAGTGFIAGAYNTGTYQVYYKGGVTTWAPSTVATGAVFAPIRFARISRDLATHTVKMLISSDGRTWREVGSTVSTADFVYLGIYFYASNNGSTTYPPSWAIDWIRVATP